MEHVLGLRYDALMLHPMHDIIKGFDPVGMPLSLATNVLAASGVSYADAQDRLTSMVRGMQKFQSHKVAVSRLMLHEVWRRGEVSLCCIPTHDYCPDNPSLVLVPSMINKSYILDLLEDRSLLRWLAAQGINAYLLDWGNSTDDDGQTTVSDVVLDRLVPALDFLHEKSGKQIHALGYCMGGTLLLGASQHLKEQLASLTLLATPWDFHAGSGGLLSAVKFWAPSTAHMLGACKKLSGSAMQSLFALLDPEAGLRKFLKFESMDVQSDEARLFMATESWVNDSVDLPYDVGRSCVYDWFLGNAPAQKRWGIGGQYVDLNAIACPVMVVAAKSDRLVEPDMALAICGDIKRVQVIQPETGHIGVIVGKNAARNVWCPIRDWIKQLP